MAHQTQESGEHTYVSKDDILAKAIFRYYPFDRFGAVK